LSPANVPNLWASQMSAVTAPLAKAGRSQGKSGYAVEAHQLRYPAL
jgi:hypothetical protein